MPWHAWFETAGSLVRLALGSPDSVRDLVVVSAVAGITLFAVMDVAGTAAGMSTVRGSRKILGLLAGLVLLLIAVTATVRLVLPPASGRALRTALLYGTPAVLMLVAGIPLVAWIARGRYVGTLIAFTLSLFAAFVMVQLTLALLASLRGGTSQGFFLKSRRDEMNRFLETGR
ncbi:MAG: hypothetical protein JW951_00785 [Lentisphaerae bacterium]|nr:hypothetical protein [Lentisphaerota bacterium]